jgi:hypothetical protein
MKNDFCKIIFHPQTPLILNAKKLLLHCIKCPDIIIRGILELKFYRINYYVALRIDEILPIHKIIKIQQRKKSSNVKDFFNFVLFSFYLHKDKTKNMHRITVYFLFISLLFFQTACNDDEMSTGDGCPAPTSIYNAGVVVINEGGFQTGTGTLSFIGENDTDVTNFIYQNANCDDILGNIVQSVSKIDNQYFIVANNANKIVVTDDKMDKIAQIDELRFPRYILKTDDNTAYITEWTDEVKGRVAVLNLDNFEIEQTIPVGGGPENLIAYQGKIYVANGGGLDEEFGDSTVSIINPLTHEVEKTLQVGNNPKSFQIDNNGDLWVGCFGFQNSFIPNDPLNKNGSLVRINAEMVQEVVELDEIGVQHLQINPTQDKLYLLYGGNPYAPVYTFDINTTTLSDTPIVETLAYGLGIHPVSGHIFVADAKGFAETGEVSEYDENGNFLQAFSTSIGPNGFLFLE